MKYYTCSLLFVLFFCVGFAQKADTMVVEGTLADTAVAKRILKEAIKLNAQKKYDEAYSKADSAQLIFVRVLGRFSNEVANILKQKAIIRQLSGNLEESLSLFEESLRIQIMLLGENDLEVAYSQYNIGRAYYFLNDEENAYSYVRKAIRTMSEKLKNSDLAYTSTCIIWGVLNQEKGNFLEAIRSYNQVINALKGTDHMNLAFAYSNLATIYEQLKDFHKSLEFQFKALNQRINILGANDLQTSDSYHNIGVAYWDIDPYKSEYYLKKSLEIRQAFPDENDGRLLSSFLGIGAIYQEKRKYEESVIYYNKAIDIAIKSQDSVSASIGYYNIATVYEELIKYDSSLFYYSKSLELRKNSLDLAYGNLPMCQASIAQIYQKKGDYDKAITLFKKVILSCGYQENQLFKDVKYLSELTSSISHLANIYLAKQYKFFSRPRPDTAHNYALQALAATEYQQNTITSEGSKTQLAENNYAIYENAIETSLLVADLNHNDSLRRTAFDYPERSKAARLRSKIKDNEALDFAEIPDSLLREEYDLRINIAWRERQRQEKIDAGHSDTDSTILALSSKIFDLRQQYDTLKSRFEKNYPEYYRLKYDLRTVPLQYVQDSLLQPGQSLLEYFVGDSSIYLFLVQPKNYEVIKIKKDTAFEQWVEDLTRNGIYGFYGKKGVSKGKSINNFGTAAHQLYQTLIAPVKAKLPKDEKLIIIPDGILGYVPFEALLAQKPPRPDAISAYKYLIQDYQISYCYSATLLKEMRNKKHRQEPSQKLLAMAPFFLGNADTLLSQVDSTDFIAGITLRDTLTALPNSGEEVARIQKNLKGQAFYGKAATLAQFQKLAAQARILHLSTHGKADDRMGDYAYLAFGMPDADGTFEKLYARDLYNLSLNADLVVLSACETGIGKLQRGEGIVSLARAFAYAGAKSIVTTLWKVSDEQSKNLMTSFYRYLGKGKDKDEALRLAKLDFLQKNEKKIELLHPFFWASFIGIGDMSKIK